MFEVPPSITGSGTPNEINALPNDDVQLICKARGVPTPVVHWSKDGQHINTNNRLNIRLDFLIME